MLTGATGFIGRHVVPLLLSYGFEVHAIYNSKPGNPGDNLVWYQADLLDERDVKKIITDIRPDFLVHLAWYAVPGKFWNAEENLLWVAATIRLVYAFYSEGGQHAIVAGSCAEYKFDDKLLNENTGKNEPNTFYGYCKNVTREIVQEYARIRGNKLSWARIFYLYGPGEPEQKIVHNAIKNLIGSNNFECTDGRQLRDYLYVKDVASALVEILNSGTTGVINISSGSGTSINELINKIASILGRPDLVKFGAIKKRDSEPDSVIGDNAKLLSKTKWEQKYSLEAGIRETIDWYKKNESISE
jgi:nucleoside-diphosphate-sugar epimerase